MTKFEAWMLEVDQFVQSEVGLSTADLPDCCYRDWHEDGVSPESAARRALKNAME